MGTTPAIVTSGPHKGRCGNIVSIPWIGNLFGLRLELNVPMTEREIQAKYCPPVWAEGDLEQVLANAREGHGPRTWINLWRWEVTTV